MTNSISPPTKRREEIVSLTSLRGILAIWVVLYHFWNDLTLLAPSLGRLSPLIHSGNMAVPSFFMLSGFVLTYNHGSKFERLNRSSYVHFLLMRLARIYPLHIITLFTVLFMVTISKSYNVNLSYDGYSNYLFALNVLLAQTWTSGFLLNWNYPSWSISSEWFAYLLFPPAVALGLRHLTTPIRALAFLLVTISGGLVMLYGWRPWPFYELLLVVPTFFTGTAVFYLLRERIGCGLWRRLPDILTLLIAISPFFIPLKLVAGFLLIFLLSLIITLVWQGSHCTRPWRAGTLLFVGDISYSLYMTHSLAQKISNRLFPAAHYKSTEPIVRLGVVVADAALIVTCCLAAYFLVERPCRVFLKAHYGLQGGANRGQGDCTVHYSPNSTLRK